MRAFVEEEWIPAPPSTIDELITRAGAGPVYFQCNDRIYVGPLTHRLAEGEAPYYMFTTVHGSDKPTRFPGSLVVTPVTFSGITPLY